MAPTIAPSPAPPGRPSTPKWGWQQRATQFFCLLILFGFPIFSVPTQKGVCTSPLDVVVTYAYIKGLLPEEWTKAVLYPASLMVQMEALMGENPQSFRLPEWDSILQTWNLSSSLVEEDKAAGQGPVNLMPNFFSMYDSHNPKSLSWEFVGACVVLLLGGFLSLGGPNKISFWGVCLVLWFIFWEGGKREDVAALPMFGLVLLCSLGWVNFKEIFSMPKDEVVAAPSAATASTASTSGDGKPKVGSKKKL